MTPSLILWATIAAAATSLILGAIAHRIRVHRLARRKDKQADDIMARYRGHYDQVAPDIWFYYSPDFTTVECLACGTTWIYNPDRTMDLGQALQAHVKDHEPTEARS